MKGKGPSRGFLRDCEIFAYLQITFVSSSSSHLGSLATREMLNSAGRGTTATSARSSSAARTWAIILLSPRRNHYYCTAARKNISLRDKNIWQVSPRTSAGYRSASQIHLSEDQVLFLLKSWPLTSGFVRESRMWRIFQVFSCVFVQYIKGTRKNVNYVNYVSWWFVHLGSTVSALELSLWIENTLDISIEYPRCWALP